jgi:hypothetical protein
MLPLFESSWNSCDTYLEASQSCFVSSLGDQGGAEQHR